MSRSESHPDRSGFTVDEFRSRAREIAAVYRSHAFEIEKLAEREWMPDANQGVYELELIHKRTDDALSTLADELDGGASR